METLTESLTKGLGFDLKADAENQRKLTIGSSFIEKKTGSESLLVPQFGNNSSSPNKRGGPESLSNVSPFG